MAYEDKHYAFSQAFLHPLVLSAEVPPGEGASPGYYAGRIAAVADIPMNFAAAAAHNLFDKLDTLDDYADMFKLMPAPKCVQTWRKDRVFAEQRLSGVHPVWIRRATNVDPSVAAALDESLTDLFGPALVESTKATHLYVCDYREILDGIPMGQWEGQVKHMVPVVGYFAWRDTQHGDRGELIPVLIKLEPRHGPPIVATPTGWPATWAIAKTFFQIADGNVHETVSHLYGAHFSMEPIAVATGRYLPPTHPVRRLLAPHLKFLLFNNDLGKAKLVNPGGFVDQLLASSLAGSLELVKRAAASFDFSAGAFDIDILDRGMGELPHYPYRDDGLLLWRAIGTYVTACLTRAYPDQARLSADESLNRWWKALFVEAKIKGLPTGTTASLVDVLQRIIFTSGPYHAAVNFPQYEYMAFSPNQPLAAYAEPSGELLDVLPPYRQAVKQLEVMEILTAYRHDAFGHYAADDTARLTAFERGRLAAFQAELSVAETTIAKRNKKRRVPYVYLQPSLVPNSTSV